MKNQSEVEEGETLDKILFVILDAAIKIHPFKNVIEAGYLEYQFGYIEEDLEQILYCDEDSYTKLELSTVRQPKPCPVIIFRGASESYLCLLVVITNDDEKYHAYIEI